MITLYLNKINILIKPKIKKMKRSKRGKKRGSRFYVRQIEFDQAIPLDVIDLGDSFLENEMSIVSPLFHFSYSELLLLVYRNSCLGSSCSRDHLDLRLWRCVWTSKFVKIFICLQNGWDEVELLPGKPQFLIK